MRRDVFAFLLALWTVLAMLPVRALASESYEITAEVVDGGEYGTVELSADRACADETVWLRAQPQEGYVVQIDGFCSTGEPWVTYAGLGRYAVTMPEGDVALQIRFVPARGALYTITGTVNNPAWGELTVSRSEAREGEWVVVEAAPRPGCVLQGLQAMGTDGLPVRGGYAENRDGVLIYEYCLPNVGVVIEAQFAREEQHDVFRWVPLTRDQMRSPGGRMPELRLVFLF